MGFDFFTQGRGPQVDIDLFPRARQIGAQTGNAIKTPLQAGIEGAISGVETGFDLVGKYQQIEIRQNQIDQQPVEDQIRQEQLKQEQAQTQVLQTRAKIDAETQTQQIDAIKAKFDQEQSDITARKEIDELLASPDPNVRSIVYRDPKYTNVLSQDTKLNEYAFGRARPGLSAQEQNSILEGINVFKARDYELAKEKNDAYINAQFSKQQNKIIEDFQGSPAFANATIGVQPSEVTDRIKVYPTGLKTVGKDGKIDESAPDNQLLDLPTDQTYTVYKDGKPTQTISSSEAGKYFKFANLQGLFNNQAKDNIYGAPSALEKAQSQKAVTSAATQGDTAYQSRLNSFGANQAIQEPTTNENIVSQKRQQFAEIAKNPPPGIQGKTLEDRLFQKKAAIRSGFSQSKDGIKVSDEAYDILSYISTLKTPKSTTTSTPKAPVDTSTPDKAVSSIAKTPVSLNFDTNHAVNNEAVLRVNSEPLLSRQSPLTKGLATVESRGKNNALSPTGVRGYLQVTKATAAQYGLNRDIPEENVLAGQLYLNDLWTRNKKDIVLALASYNAGPDNIAKAVDDAGTTDWTTVKEYLKNYLSEAKYNEVKDYPERVLTASTKFLGQNQNDDDYFYGMLQVSGLVKPS